MAAEPQGEVKKYVSPSGVSKLRRRPLSRRERACMFARRRDLGEHDVVFPGGRVVGKGGNMLKVARISNAAPHRVLIKECGPFASQRPAPETASSSRGGVSFWTQPAWQLHLNEPKIRSCSTLMNCVDPRPGGMGCLEEAQSSKTHGVDSRSPWSISPAAALSG